MKREIKASVEQVSNKPICIHHVEGSTLTEGTHSWHNWLFGVRSESSPRCSSHNPTGGMFAIRNGKSRGCPTPSRVESHVEGAHVAPFHDSRLYNHELMIETTVQTPAVTVTNGKRTHLLDRSVYVQSWTDNFTARDRIVSQELSTTPLLMTHAVPAKKRTLPRGGLFRK